MSLLTYKEVRPWAAAIRQAVRDQNDAALESRSAIRRMVQRSAAFRSRNRHLEGVGGWNQSGRRRQGHAGCPDFHDGWKIGKPDLVISVPERKLEASGPDYYASVDIPTNFKEDRWIVAAELRPGNRKIVHHAHVFVKEEAKKAVEAAIRVADYARWLIVHEGTLQWMRPEAPVIDNGCSVDDNGLVPGRKLAEMGNLLSSYLPGRDAEPFPEGTARKIPAGATLEFPDPLLRGPPASRRPIPPASASSSPPTRPQQVLYYSYLSNQMFRIPPGAADHRVTDCHTFDKDLRIMSLTPHMHLRGKPMRYIAHYPDGRAETLLYVPAYNFNWQFTYHAKKPIAAPERYPDRGDRRVRQFLQ